MQTRTHAEIVIKRDVTSPEQWLLREARLHPAGC